MKFGLSPRLLMRPDRRSASSWSSERKSRTVFRSRSNPRRRETTFIEHKKSPNPGMMRWFDEELMPMMLEVEAKIKRLVAHQKAPLPTRDDDRYWQNNGRRQFVEQDEVVYDEADNDESLFPPNFKLHYSDSRFRNGKVDEDYYAPEEPPEDHQAIEKLQQFLQESAAHQRHMEDVRRERREAEIQFVPDTQGPVEIPLPSDVAPQSQPHKSRFEALVSLYGDSADSIVSMETNLQARFDRSVDATQPRYWPIIPLRF